MKIRNGFILLFLLFVAVACQTVQEGVILQEQGYSVNEIRSAIHAVVGEPRSVSENGREFVSQYFGRKADSNFNPDTAKERLYVHFWILGDRRPYDIKVLVNSERRNSSGRYKLYGEDIGFGNKIAKELKAKLSQSLEKRNVIDDFRPF